MPKNILYNGRKNMKEYKSLKVAPEEETDVIQFYDTFGWKLEETREVYNESQEFLGEKYTSYNAFMQGFTGNDGKVEVQTRTNVTHFLSMRFSRETTMKHYNRLSALQNEFEGLEYLPYIDLPNLPILATVLGVFGIISLILPIIAIVSWIRYASLRKKAIQANKLADETNPGIKARAQQIIAEARKLVDENNAA